MATDRRGRRHSRLRSPTSCSVDVIEYPLIFLAGLAGSWHCVGMCGGFACALGSDPRGRARHAGAPADLQSRPRHHLLLHRRAGRLPRRRALRERGGRTADVGRAAHPGDRLRPAHGLASACSSSAGSGAGTARRCSASARQFLAPALRDLLRAPGPAAPLAFGVFNGFLPCPLVYAFAAQAAGSGGALPGLLVMLAFGLGTFPAMLLMAGLGGWLRRVGGAWQWRRRGVDVAGAFIVLLGLITFARGVVPDRRASAPAMTATGTSPALCSHCLLPIRGLGHERQVQGEDHRFCCYGCCLAFQVARGEGEELEAAWLLIRLGTGAFLSMNVMLFSLLLYSGTFERSDAERPPAGPPPAVGAGDAVHADPGLAALPGGLAARRPGAA